MGAGRAWSAKRWIVTSDSLSGASWNNWILKHQYAQLVALSESHRLDATVGRVQTQKSLGDDEIYWHRWYARNNGAIGFLGDHTAGESGTGTTVLACLLVALTFGLAGVLLK